VGHLRYIQWYNYYHLSGPNHERKQMFDVKGRSWCFLFLTEKLINITEGAHFSTDWGILSCRESGKHYGPMGKYHKTMARRCFHKNWHCALHRKYYVPWPTLLTEVYEWEVHYNFKPTLMLAIFHSNKMDSVPICCVINLQPYMKMKVWNYGSQFNYRRTLSFRF
jgi:hypothetical protein